MKLRSILLALLFMAGSCLAADVDGRWSSNLSMQGSDFPVNFAFKADGATLTGSTTGPDGTEIKISDGKVDGNDITLSVSFGFGGGSGAKLCAQTLSGESGFIQGAC